jgi:hypothetical protein
VVGHVGEDDQGGGLLAVGGGQSHDQPFPRRVRLARDRGAVPLDRPRLARVEHGAEPGFGAGVGGLGEDVPVGQAEHRHVRADGLVPGVDQREAEFGPADDGHARRGAREQRVQVRADQAEFRGERIAGGAFRTGFDHPSACVMIKCHRGPSGSLRVKSPWVRHGGAPPTGRRVRARA